MSPTRSVTEAALRGVLHSMGKLQRGEAEDIFHMVCSHQGAHLAGGNNSVAGEVRNAWAMHPASCKQNSP